MGEVSTGSTSSSLFRPISSKAVFEVGAVRKGASWTVVELQLQEWFAAAAPQVREGTSLQLVPGLGFDLAVHLEKRV
jgi:hypothetical protein